MFIAVCVILSLAACGGANAVSGDDDTDWLSAWEAEDEGEDAEFDEVRAFVLREALELGIPTGWIVGRGREGVRVYVADSDGLDAATYDELAARVGREFPEVIIERGPELKLVPGRGGGR